MDVRRLLMMSNGSSKNIDETTAGKMAEQMINVDGSPAPHWTMAEVKAVMKDRKINHSLPEFFLVLNMLYADYVQVLSAFGANKLDVYIEMAKAWLEDEDAKDHKVQRYFETIVK